MTETPSLVLYSDAYWISPYVFTCFVALREKGLAFELREVALQDGANKQPAYRDRTITGRVPALEHDGFFLAESSAIVEYLEDVFPVPHDRRLLPEPARDRARARQVMAWIRSDLMALREERSTATMFYARAEAPLTPAGQAARDKLLHVADLLIPEEGSSMFGAWSIADADLAFMLHRLILNEHEVSPKIRRYAEVQWARPSVREFVDHERRPFVPYA
jgi:glutathione S-transferase